MDKKRDSLILEEFKRLGDKIVAENTQLDLRVTALEKARDDERMKRMLDQKVDRTEFSDFVNMLTEGTIKPHNLEIEKANRNIKYHEVSAPRAIVRQLQLQTSTDC